MTIRGTTIRHFRPSPAMAVALIALIVAAGGTAVAAGKIGTNQIENNAVTKKKIRKKAVSTNRLAAKAVTNGKIGPEAVKSGKIDAAAVTGSKIADDAVDASKISDGAVGGTEIADNAIGASKVADDSLDDSKTSDYEVLGDSLVRVVATNGPNAAAARNAAPEQVLYSKGPLEVYAKCYRDAPADTTFGVIYARTATDGSVIEGEDDLPGGPAAGDYLNAGTAEINRQLHFESATGNAAEYDEGEGSLASADGTALSLITTVGVKNGAVFADGPYGPGNACVFHGAAMG